MCGIAGFVDFDNRLAPLPVLNAMTHALGRRGPDATGVKVEGPCGLAHARLSIIDVAGSPQPMAVPDLEYDIVFNGEVYNYQKLRVDLEALGEKLVTNGDTEVLMRWAARGWETSLLKFDAMFAFALWDRRRQRMLLGRDAIGEKPLFYATPRPGLVVFGSEIKAVLAHPEVDRGLDVDSLRQALRFRAVYGERSLHKGVKQLPPGHFMEVTREGLRIAPFYDIVGETRAAQESLAGLSDEQIVTRGENILKQSVAERLVADVPVGAFLSGGLDSSLIVALMRQIRAPGEEVRTFSVGFNNDAQSELPFARTVANLIGSQHTEVLVGEEHYAARLSELSACRDAPVSEPADVAVAEMSRVARQSVKVVLSGEGSDEVFCGYPKYRFAAAGGAMRGAMRALGADRVAWLAGKAGVDRRRALVAARALSLPSELDRLVQWFSYFDRKDLQALLPGLGWSDGDWEGTTVAQSKALGSAAGLEPAVRMQVVDCLTWLPGNMLERGDRMTMAEGLEGRMPFLDKELIAFGLALPSRMKIRGNTLKWIVRQWGNRCLPAEIFERKKWGFRVPLAAWFRGSLRWLLHERLTASHGLCATYGDPKAIQSLLARHEAGATDLNLTLWTLLSAETWYQDVYLARQSPNASLSPARVRAA